MRLDNCKFAPPSFTTVNFTWAGFPFSCNLSQLLPTYFLLATFFKTTASHITSYNLLYQIVHFSCMETCVQTFISRLLAPCFNACSLMFHVLHLFSQSLQSLISRPTISHGFHWQLSSRTTFMKAMTAILSSSDPVLLWLKSDSEFAHLWHSSHWPSLTCVETFITEKRQISRGTQKCLDIGFCHLDSPIHPGLRGVIIRAPCDIVCNAFISFSGAISSHFILLQSSKKFFPNVTCQLCLILLLLRSISPV